MQGMFKKKKIKEDPFANSNIRALTGENLFTYSPLAQILSEKAKMQTVRPVSWIFVFLGAMEEVRVRI